MKRPNRKVTFLTISLVAFVFIGFLTAGKALFNSVFDDFKNRGEAEATSIDEARSRGILMRELKIDPPEFERSGVKIHFGQAWIERRSQPSHRFVWFTSERSKGGYRLHFKIERCEGIERSDLRFRLGATGASSMEISDEKGRIRCFPIEDADADVALIRMNVLRKSDELLASEIRFDALR
jgi:hypothetical protein